ncbi:unnamed protein product [Arabidopsis halleri]
MTVLLNYNQISSKSYNLKSYSYKLVIYVRITNIRTYSCVCS